MTTTTQPQGNGFNRDRLRALAPMLIFDIGGPLALYWLLRAAGSSEVTALIVSGILPAVGMALSIVKKRRVDAIGALVLLGIVTGTVLGLATHSARLVLMEGSVPTAIFGFGCLASLLTTKPMLQRIAEQTTAGTAKGRILMAKAAQPAGRHAFRVVTVVWGVAFLAEAAARVGIVESVSGGNALLVVKVMPYAVMFLLMRWTAPFIRRSVRGDDAWQAEVAAQGEIAAQDQATAGERTREPAMIG
jgi:intracellular septation protein A